MSKSRVFSSVPRAPLYSLLPQAWLCLLLSAETEPRLSSLPGCSCSAMHQHPWDALLAPVCDCAFIGEVMGLLQAASQDAGFTRAGSSPPGSSLSARCFSLPLAIC